MPRRRSHEKNLGASQYRRIWLWSASLAFVAVGCALEDYGTQSVPGNQWPTNTSSSSSSGDLWNSSSSNGSSSSSGNAGQGGVGGMGGAGGIGGAGGAGGGTTVDIPKTCMDILTANPGSPSGTYTVDPDGPDGNMPFSVTCKMLGSYAWTLVGLEKPNDTANLRLLGVEKGTPADLLASNSAIIGVLFKGLYKAVRIEWDNTRYIEFKIGNTELFDDTVNVAVPITGLSTSETTLSQWTNGGAKFCRGASKSANKLPGDSSWAIKPKSDNNNNCGCNSPAWAGQGAFYSGTNSNCTSCACHDGGFAGVKDNGEAKSVTVNWETRIYVL